MCIFHLSLSRCRLELFIHIVDRQVHIIRGVYELGQPKKFGQTHPKNQKKKMVGFGNWVGMVSKNEKPIKVNGFRVKPDPDKKNPLTQYFLSLFS